MVKWPKSKGKQATIALATALLAAIWVFIQVDYGYFQRFYFEPNKRYPYPYPNEHVAQMALYRECGLAIVGVFLVVFAIQRIVAHWSKPTH